MSPAERIEAALKRGAVDGLDALNPFERKVWLISEAEVLSDMEGIDSFLDAYREFILEASDAFEAVGALKIAQSLRAIHASQPQPPDELLNETNKLLTGREGYNYDAILRFAAQYA